AGLLEPHRLTEAPVARRHPIVGLRLIGAQRAKTCLPKRCEQRTFYRGITWPVKLTGAQFKCKAAGYNSYRSSSMWALVGPAAYLCGVIRPGDHDSKSELPLSVGSGTAESCAYRGIPFCAIGARKHLAYV